MDHGGNGGVSLLFLEPCPSAVPQHNILCSPGEDATTIGELVKESSVPRLIECPGEDHN